MPAQLEVLSGDLSGRRYLVEDDEFLIGRAPSCDLVIPKRYISREHARIVRKEGAYVIDGLSETNPVLVEARPANGRRLADGDEFELCGIRIRFSAQGGAVPRRHAGVAMRSGSAERPPAPDGDSWRDPSGGGKVDARDDDDDDDDTGEAATSPRPIKREPAPAAQRSAARSNPGKVVFGDDDDGPKDEAERTAELPARGSTAGKGGTSTSAAKGGGSKASAAGAHGESSNERTAELGKVQDPNDPDYDPFAAVEAKKKKEKKGDPAREKLLKGLMVLGAVGIVLAVGMVKVLTTKPEWTDVYATTPIRLALNQTVRFEEPFASIDRPAGPTRTRLDGEPILIAKDNVCEVEWAVPHVKGKVILLIRGRELGDTQFGLEFPETRRRKWFKVEVAGDDPAEAVREKRRGELRGKSPLDLRRLADAQRARGEAFERERETVRKEANYRLALREYVKAVDAAITLRNLLAKQGTVPPADSERVKVCEDAESRARSDYEEFVNREIAKYRAALQQGAQKLEIVQQLKRVLRAIANANDVRFMRLRLLLEESFGVPFDGDGSELEDEG